MHRRPEFYATDGYSHRDFQSALRVRQRALAARTQVLPIVGLGALLLDLLCTLGRRSRVD